MTNPFPVVLFAAQLIAVIIVKHAFVQDEPEVCEVNREFVLCCIGCLSEYICKHSSLLYCRNPKSFK